MANASERRIAALRALMIEQRIDLVALGPTSHMQWLAGLSPHGDERPVMVFVSQAYVGVLMPALNAAAARQQTALPFHEWSDEQGPAAALADLIARCDIPSTSPSVALDETMRADFALLLLDQFDRPRHQFAVQTVGLLRSQKDDGERADLLESARINDLAFAAAFDALVPGKTERELCDLIKDTYAAHGAEPVFCSVCFGQNTAFPHHTSGDTALEQDMAILIDAGCRVNGYCSDMTRCGWFGTPPEDYLEVAKTVEAALDAGIAAAKIGQAAKTLDMAARQVITQAGYGPFFTHRTGHGLGLDVHEEPYLTATSETILAEGNAYTVEPGIYLPGKFGIRLEEEVILEAGGPVVLTKFPRLKLIG